MKIDEAILRSGEDWFRPVSWRRGGQAFCLKDGKTQIVPGNRGGDTYMTPDVDALTGEWEIVTPDTVLAEISAAQSDD